MAYMNYFKPQSTPTPEEEVLSVTGRTFGPMGWGKAKYEKGIEHKGSKMKYAHSDARAHAAEEMLKRRVNRQAGAGTAEYDVQ